MESFVLLSHDINFLSSNVKVSFQWCPGHCQISENEIAHKLAQSATEKGRNIQPPLRPFPIARAIVFQNAENVKNIDNATSLAALLDQKLAGLLNLLTKGFRATIQVYYIMAN